MLESTKLRWKRLLIGELSAKRLVKSVAFIYGSLAAFAYLGSNRLLFQPQPASYTPNADVLMLDVRPGVRIAARYLPATGARSTILFNHGNAEDLGDVAPLVEHLRDLGANVLVYDYEGYGASQGEASEKHVYEDVEAAYRYLVQRLHVAPGDVIAYGRSLGGGPAVELASREPIGGLVLESTFTSAFRVMTRIPLFPGDKFKNLAKMSRVRCPVLVMHGRRDRVIPFHHGEALLDAVQGVKLHLWVDGADHAEVQIADERAYDGAVREILARVARTGGEVGADVR